MPVTKNNKLMQLLNYRVRITSQDNRSFVGTFKAFDKHMNVILGDAEEYRFYKTKEGPAIEKKRTLGFLLMRGEAIISLTMEGPPPPEDNVPRLPLPGSLPGPGTAHPAGRGIPMVNRVQPMVPGMAHGTYSGIGAPSASMMRPGGRM